VCGAPDCPWSSAIQTCWFTPYLPDVRYRHPDALGLAADDAVWWLERFDLDGFRVDAVPMRPRAATRRIARAVRDRAWEGRGTFLLGEIFTGPGAGAYDQLRTYLGRDTLDSLFDFPRMWALRDAIAQEGEWESVDAVLDVGEAAFRGSGATIATMLDNHDVPRFMAAMTGDAGRDAWESSPPQPDDAAAYERMRLGLTALFTLPGMPVLYYGDEVGLTGAGDPDNRRVMPAEAELLDEQRATREHTARLSRLRRCSEALRRGDRATLATAGPAWAYARGLDTPSPVLIALNAGATEASLATSAWPPGAWIDASTGDAVAIEAGSSIAVASRSARVLVRADSTCRLQ
jgi:glycosidase